MFMTTMVAVVKMMMINDKDHHDDYDDDDDHHDDDIDNDCRQHGDVPGRVHKWAVSSACLGQWPGM
jgi:hypothetical protein